MRLDDICAAGLTLTVIAVVFLPGTLRADPSGVTATSAPAAAPALLISGPVVPGPFATTGAAISTAHPSKKAGPKVEMGAPAVPISRLTDSTTQNGARQPGTAGSATANGVVSQTAGLSAPASTTDAAPVPPQTPLPPTAAPGTPSTPA